MVPFVLGESPQRLLLGQVVTFAHGLLPSSTVPSYRARVPKRMCTPRAHRTGAMPFAGELRLNGVLGASLSSGAARGRLRICDEVLEDGIGDAPFEAPQRLLTGLALRDLLAVIH